MNPFTQKFAIVDIETTGQSATKGRITEIAIIITDGVNILDTYSSLVNPETPIPAFITSLTGIDDELVQDAPTFRIIAKDVKNFLKDHIFVAHNVGFDYNFIKAELEREGIEFNMLRFCTVKLSRAAFPGLYSYSLGKLCDQLDVELTDRHRAMGDTLATTKVFHKIVDENGYQWVFNNIVGLKKGLVFPPNINPLDVQKLPTKPGVYYFIDENGNCIYVGKAIDIKKRILSHFYSKNFKTSEVCKEIHHVDYKECGSDLIASLFELHEIKKIFPKYNTLAKFPKRQYAIYKYMDQNGYIRLKAGVKRPAINHFIGTFESLSKARTILYQLADDFGVCNSLNGLISKDDLCSKAIMGVNCACSAQLEAKDYNQRIQLIVNNLEDESQTKVLKLKGTKAGESCFLNIENDEVKISFVQENDFVDIESLSWKYIPNIAETRQIINLYFRKKRVG